ncbi:MAG: nucleotidyltransferase family protein [Actinomycetota bacterium]|nr:nucleotidyltransferase family protein [Actinomycetota bacterium]
MFGSVARGEQGPDSDLDLLVHLPEDAGLLLLGRVGDELHKLLGVPVHVVPDDALKPRVRASMEPDFAPARSRRTATARRRPGGHRRHPPPPRRARVRAADPRAGAGWPYWARFGRVLPTRAVVRQRQLLMMCLRSGQLWMWRTRHGPTARQLRCCWSWPTRSLNTRRAFRRCSG